MDIKQLEYGIARYGTPLYIFDMDRLGEDIKMFRKALGNLGLCFAMKANPFLTAQMGLSVDRIEVCSMGEFRICKELCIPPEKVLISGVLKKKEDIREILNHYRGKCTYTIESQSQLHSLVQWSDTENEELNVYLRLTSKNQFGMDEQTIHNIIEKRERHSLLKIRGIHYFSGTQKKSAGKIQKEIEYLDNFFQHLENTLQFHVEALEYGPGLAVPYFAGQEETMAGDIRKLTEAVSAMTWKGNVTFEMGRALSAMCGYYLTTVRDIKQNDGRNYCLADGGVHQMNYDGQIRGMYEPYMQVSPQGLDGKEENWTVCGALCTVNDVLVQNISIKNLKVGNILIFERTGAYSMTEGMALFLSHDLPKVVRYSEKSGWELLRDTQPTYGFNMPQTR